MSKFGTLVMGPAGAGKTTFCSALIQHLQNSRRSCFYINLDPAAEEFAHQPDLDIKDLISLEDVMDEVGLGPNGALIYCFEFLLENLDFLSEAIDPLTEEYLIIIDMPGQIELYTHVPVVPALVRHLTRDGSLNVSLCAAYLLEATFMIDRAKYFAGTLSAMSAMLLLEIPHINVLSKMDLARRAGLVSKSQLKRFVDPDASLLLDPDAEPIDVTRMELAQARQVEMVGGGGGPAGGLGDGNGNDGRNEDLVGGDPNATKARMGGSSFKRLNRAVAQLIEDFSLVSFLQLDVQDEDSVGAILSYIDDAIQYHEAQEPRDPKDELPDDGGGVEED